MTFETSPQVDAQIERLKERLGVKHKAEVLRRALDALEREEAIRMNRGLAREADTDR